MSPCPPYAGTRASPASCEASIGTPELPKACQGPPKHYENIINSMVLARCPSSPEVIVLVDPLAKLGPLLTQTGAQWAPWQGRQDTKITTKVIHDAKA